MDEPQELPPGAAPPSEPPVRPRGPDRRRRPTPILSRYTFSGGQRVAGRREGETDNIYVDVYSPRLVILLLFFFALTVVDSVSTLVYLGKGGRELNPIAQWMIDQGPSFFVIAKGVLSGLCLLFVMLHKTFRPARVAMAVGFSFYFALGAYHLVLQILAL
jgi:Domain of unknown function (DUF5658)